MRVSQPVGRQGVGDFAAAAQGRQMQADALRSFTSDRRGAKGQGGAIEESWTSLVRKPS